MHLEEKKMLFLLINSIQLIK